jgi:two-component system, OmpR family, sensor histidine kinase MprB
MTRRVALASLLVVTLVVGLVGLAVYDRFAREQLQNEDSQLTALASRPLTLLLRPTSSELAELRRPDGSTVFATPTLSSIGVMPPTRPGYTTIDLADHSLRVYTRRLPGGRLLVVALDRAPSIAALRRLRRLLAFGGLAAGVLTALALVGVTRRALTPLRRVAEVAETITRTGDLGHRVPPVSGSHEPALLAHSINEMLDRLNDSDDALRRMIADASHELRTPLTTLRGNLELLGSSVALPEPDRSEALQDATAEAARMQMLIDDMLDLARSEAIVRREAISLRSLIDGAPEGIGLLGDRASLERMLENLQLNASRYAGGSELAVSADDDVVTIRVVDRGPGVPADERERVFERFARGRASQATPGSGLGLSIARNIARNHGGDIRLADTPGGGATFVVTLPQAAAANGE